MNALTQGAGEDRAIAPSEQGDGQQERRARRREPAALLLEYRTGEEKGNVAETRFMFLHFLLGDRVPLVRLCCNRQGFKEQKYPCIFPCCHVFLP